MGALLAAPAGARAEHERVPPRWIYSAVKMGPLGWTADSEFLFERTVEYFPMETIDDPSVPPMRLTFGLRWDARRGREIRYVLGLTTADGRPTMRDELRNAPGPDQWRVFVAEHAPVLAGGPLGPGGARAFVTGATGEWVATRYDFDLAAGGVLSLGVEHEGQRRGAPLTYDDNRGRVRGWALPVWSPDGRRVAWLLHVEPTMPFEPPVQLFSVMPVGPTVHVAVREPDLERSNNALVALEALGLAPVGLVAAPEVHVAGSVVWAAPGWEDEARRVLAALPGGGEVRPLDGRTAADLVIAPAAALFEGPADAALPAWGDAPPLGAPKPRDWRPWALAVAVGLGLVLAWLRFNRGPGRRRPGA